ncbi:hypothetical protein VaNZ11_012161 [Volvox africanus]|uniref:3'-5' exonuclease domain-containing protein n=1 Tax=Volvox africanus TaxID=51714 RepID=A0ABQ5SEG8_9CHLO|nr:hypothetical protein VaNZ11_012161 [Volvox africanus]
MMSRQLYIGNGGAHHTWLDKTQGVVLLTGQVHYALRHYSPVSHRGKNVACSFGGGSRADPMDPHATAEPASHAASRLTPDQATELPAPPGRSEITKPPASRDGEWEREGLQPLDAEATNMLNGSSRIRVEPVSSSNIGGMNGPTYSSPGGGRRRRRAGGGTSLDDEEGTWDFETYYDERTKNDDGGVAEAAAAGAGASSSTGFRDPDVFIARSGSLGRGLPLTQRDSNDDDEAGSPAEVWSQRGGRDGRGRRWWEHDWEYGGDRNGNDRAPGSRAPGSRAPGSRAPGSRARVWLRASDPGSGLDIGEWGDTELDDLQSVDGIQMRGGGMGGDVGGGMGDRHDGGGGLRGGRRAVIASESALRRDLAAVSTRLPRIGLSVTFPLLPASCIPAVPEAAAAATTAVTPAAVPLPPSPKPGQAGESAGFQQQAPPATDMDPSAGGNASAAPSTMPTVSPEAAAAGGPHDWATVPLLYSFGPNFKLLEEDAVPQEVPLPEELLALTGRLPDSGGGGRSAVDALLPGCTAFTIAGDYQILLVQNSLSVDTAVAWLRASVGEDRVVGVDAEWPPTFKAGTSPRLAMLQLASTSRVLLLHIAQMRRKVTAPGGPIHSLLSDASLTWVGSGWGHSDRFVMMEAFGNAALPPAVVDVQVAARAAGWPRVGLLGLVNDLMGVSEFQKPRKLSMCNWAAATMSGRQIRYAALDALLPLILLRQLRLFAAMPGLRCSFCKQAMHAPLQHEHIPPAPSGSLPVCEHCGRTIRRFSVDESSCDISMDEVVGVQPADVQLQARAPTHVSPSAARPASKAGSLRTYLQSVVEGRQLQRRTMGQRVLRHRRLFSSHDTNAGSDPELESDSGSGSDFGDEEGENKSVRCGGKQPTAETTAGKSKGKRKKKRTVRPVAGGAATPASSSRQQALWHAFEEASPAAAAAVVLAMAGEEGSRGDAAAPADGAQ